MRRSNSSVSLMVDKQQQDFVTSLTAMGGSTATNGSGGNAAYNSNQSLSPTASSGKELNWRKLSKGYALRTALALQAGGKGARASVSLLALLLCLLGVATLARRARVSTLRPSGPRYAVYIDGGSSGTRVHVFQYTLKPWPRYASFALPEPSQAVEPGLSHFADQAELAGSSIKKLLDFAYSKVPKPLWGATPVRLLATAGLRLLTEQQQQDILDSCRAVLQASPFVFKPEWAAVITGDMEGVYAWIGANYASGALEAAQLMHTSPHRRHYHHQGSRRGLDLDHNDLEPATDPSGVGAGHSKGEGGGSVGSGAPGGQGSLPPVGQGPDFQGVLELGGASFQVTFSAAPQRGGEEARHLDVQLPGVDLKVFTHSYLGLGMDAAMARAAELLQQQAQQAQQAQHHQQQRRSLTDGAPAETIEDPCLPMGYTASDGRVGTSSFSHCLELAQAILPLSPGCLATQGGPEGSSAVSTGPGGPGGAGREGGTQRGRSDRAEGEAEGSAHGGVTIGEGRGRAGEGAASGSGRSKAMRGGRSADSDLDAQGHSLSPLGAPPGAGARGAGRAVLGGVGGERAGATGAGGGGRGRCRVDGVEVPPLAGGFLAVENLYWTAKALGLSERPSLQELREAGQRHCAQHWTSLQALYSGHMPDQYITRYCFGAAYIFVLLHLGLGLALDDRRMAFTNALPGRNGGRETPLNWVTGAVLVEAMREEQQWSEGTSWHPVTEGGGIRVGGVGALGAGEEEGGWGIGDGRGGDGGRQRAPIVLVLVLLIVILVVLLAAVVVALMPPQWLRGWWQGPEGTGAQGGGSIAGRVGVGAGTGQGQGGYTSSSGGAFARPSADPLGRAAGGPTVPPITTISPTSGLAQGAGGGPVAPPSPSRSSGPSRLSRLGGAAGSGAGSSGALVRPTSLTSIDVRN